MSRSATPTTQSEGGCNEVPRLPRLPRKVKVDVTKCHACHAKRRGATAPPDVQARRQSQPSAISATPATQSNNRCRQAPRLPHKVKVDVTKRHACHAKSRWMSRSATPATQHAAAPRRHLMTKRAARANPVP